MPHRIILHSHSPSPSLSHTADALSHPHFSQSISLSVSLTHRLTFTLSHSPASPSHPHFSQSVSLSVSTISHRLRQKVWSSHKKLWSSHSKLWVYAVSQKLKTKVSCFVPTVQCLVAEKHAWKIKESLVHLVLFYFGFWNKTVNLLKNIEALLFFEIELVCGFEFFCFVLIFQSKKREYIRCPLLSFEILLGLRVWVNASWYK